MAINRWIAIKEVKMKILKILLTIFILGFSHLSFTQASDTSFYMYLLPPNVLLQLGIELDSLRAVKVALDRGADPSGNIGKIFEHHIHSAVDIPEPLREYISLREPLLSYAIILSFVKGDFLIVDELIHAGADVNAKNIHGVTPLDRAISLHQKIIIRDRLLDLMDRLNVPSFNSTQMLISRNDEIKKEPLPRLSQVNELIKKLSEAH